MRPYNFNFVKKTWVGKWGGVIGLRQVGSGIFQNELFSGKVYVFNSLMAPLCWG